MTDRRLFIVGLALVAYGYLGLLWRGLPPSPVVFVREWVNKPLGIGEDFAYLGIAVLLIAFGLLITPELLHRLTLPVAAVLMLGIAGVLLGSAELGGVLRPVCALVLFVAIWAPTRRWPWISVLLQLEAAYALLLLGKIPGLHQAGLIAEYLPLLTLGMLIRLGTWRAVLLGVLCVSVPGVAETVYPELTGWWHALTVLYAVLFVLLLRRNPDGAQPESRYLHGLDFVRVLASCLVVYAHIQGWLIVRGQHWWLTDWVQANVIGTLQLNDRLSILGVTMFLVVSGVVVTYVTQRENPGQFLWRRLTRIAPLLWVVTPLVWILITVGQRVGDEVSSAGVGVGDLLRGLVLANFFTSPLERLVGVTWTLVIQVAFYCYVAAAIPALRRRPWIPPMVVALVCFVVVLATAGSRNQAVLEVHQICAYLPLLCIGQLISLAHTGQVHRATAALIGAVHLALFTWMDQVAMTTYPNYANVRTAVLVVLFVAVMMNVNGPVSRSKLIRNWSKRTYAIYLVHTACIFAVMDHFASVIGPDAGIVLSLAVSAGVAEILHRFVEMPAERLLRARRSPVRQ
ncbi:acyltransferase family protein [Actinocrispum sp. NPDC049592]|uniref:acyltransferase family protein n=1 Tax=Actinocrispum sp. NPDC049592 TaxID=3154835 RepID=UPI003447BC99